MAIRPPALRRVTPLLSGGWQIEAPAKVNLTLRVTGRRADGYHLLESLFAFTRRGDMLRAEPADAFTFTTVGPFAAELRRSGGAGDGNLAQRALIALAAALGVKPHGRFTLVKNLPVAAGIGGGSMDAAAALLLGCALWGQGAASVPLAEIAVSLGADVSAGLYKGPLWVTGVGEQIEATMLRRAYPILLVNPGVKVATPRVFANFARHPEFSPLLGARPDIWQSTDLLHCRNDLTRAAQAGGAEIADVLAALQTQQRAWLARMSGSGATCYALFDTMEDAARARDKLRRAHGSWWYHLDRLDA